MTVSPNRTMLPPIWVAACDSQRRRNARFRKTASAPGGPVEAGAVGRRGGASGPRRPASCPPRRRDRSRGRPDRARRSDRDRRAPRTRRCVAPGRRRSSRTCRLAGQAAQADVGARAGRPPAVAAARMRRAQAHDIAEQQGQDGSGRHGGQGIRGGADRWPGRDRGRSPGTSSRSTGVTSTTTSGWVAAELGDDRRRTGSATR